MSTELIGFENLPNAFIKSIEIYNYKSDQIEVKVTVCVHDMEENSIWFDSSEELSKLLRIGLVMSTDQDESTQLNTGEISPTSVDKQTRALPMAKKMGDKFIFEVNFRKVIPSNTQHLNVYAFCFVDKKQTLDSLGFELSEDYYGPVKSDKVFSNGNLFKNSTVFQRQNGEYWAGPVHSSRTGFMIGSRHTQRPHERLTKLTVTNSKIKDYRQVIGKKSSNMLKLTSYLSPLTVSYSSDTDVNSMFMLNVKSLLKNKTKHGNFLEKASSQILDLILNNFKINLLTIQRQRIKEGNGVTPIGSKKKQTQKIFSKKNIIKTYDQDNQIKNTTRLEKKTSHDVVVADLRSNRDGALKEKGEIFIEELESYKKIAMIQELFMDYGKEIRTFQFNDYEMTSKTPGKYKYKLDFFFSDPIALFLENTVRAMKSDLSLIKRLVAFKSRNRNTDSINLQDLVNSYINYFSYLYEISSEDRNNMFFQKISMLDRKTSTLKSVKKFQKEFEDLYSEFLRFLDFDAEKLISKKEPVSVKAKEATSSRIQITKVFEKTIEPSKNFVGFSYLDETVRPSLKIFSKRDIAERASAETEKHFLGQTNTSSPDLDAKANVGINDLATTSTAYFGPVAMSVGKQMFGLQNVANAPYSKINSAFKFLGGKANIGVSVKSPSTPTSPPPEDTGETFVDASKILGSSHEFVGYTEVIDSYNVVEKTSKSSNKVDNSLSGFRKDRTFDVVLTKIKDVPPEETAMLPNQLKAVISGESEATRANYVTPSADLLAHPDTKNYFELSNFSVQELVYVDGFQSDSDGNLMMDKPVFKLMSMDNFSSVARPVVCFIQNYTNNNFNITDENPVSVIDSSFIMSDIDITVKRGQPVTTQLPDYTAQDINYEFMSSNIVVQTNQKLDVEIQNQSQSSIGTTTQIVTTPIINPNTFGTY